VNLKVLVEKIGVPDESVQSTVVSQRASTDLSADQAVVNLASCDWWIRKEPRVAFLEFDRSRKSMSCLVRTETGKNRLLVKVISKTKHSISLAGGREVH
jgi:Ca2+-transporting ATPase